MRAIELGGEPPRAVLEGTRDEVRALAPLLLEDFPLAVQGRAAGAAPETGNDASADADIAPNDDIGDALDYASDYIEHAQQLLFVAFPDLNSDETEKALPQAVLDLRRALSEAGGWIDLVRYERARDHS